MSGQQYNNYDSDLQFDAHPNYDASAAPAPAFDAFSNQPPLQPAWAAPQQGQPNFNQGFEQQQAYGGPSDNNYSHFDAPPTGEMEQPQETLLSNQAPTTPRHPFTIFFHVAFKAAAILCFLFISGNSVPSIITVLCLTAADFWTTKNVTGRLLVGLRWWNEVKEDGENEWVFESLEGQRQILQSEALIFWGALIGNSIGWLILCIVELISISLLSLQICLIVFVLSIANLIGYFKCARDATSRVKALATSFVVNQAVGYVATNNSVNK